MGLMLGAPRTMQALARDGVLPSFLGRAYGKTRNPRIATVATFAVALTGILLGDLNRIAPILSMFFLTSYGLINVSAGIESLIGTPSWRPKFRVHWSISLAGAFVCFFAMFMINAGATFIAAFLSVGLYYFMTRRSLQARWGDMRYGILMHMAQFAVLRMARGKPDERTWQPNILVLSGSPTARWYLIELADAIAQGRSFITVAAVVPETRLDGERNENMAASIREHLRKKEIPALVKLYPADDPLVGARELIRGYGFGPLVPNTILVGQTEQRERFIDYSMLIRQIHQTRRNMLIVREGNATPRFKRGKRIDVWWRGKRENVGLMLSLAWLLNHNPRWAKGRLVLKSIVRSEEERDEVLESSERFIKNERLQAETEVTITDESDPFDAIRSASAGASLVFIGMRAPEDGESAEEFSRYYENLLDRTKGLPPTVIVMAAEDIEFHRIFQSG
ncbi:MAG: amino acid permease, partial [Candidatus Hydrogenedentes bacterium]|nr:amino acid permease [Candidatus Hydrogenedentota bacterium]